MEQLIAIATVVIAVGTVSLWYVTWALARETRRMVDAGSRPHIVATLDPNQWSMMHFDLRVENTGNATAYDIKLSFDPPLVSSSPRDPAEPAPLGTVDVLKPGQGLTSYLAEAGVVLPNTYRVSITWKRDPQAAVRETNSYTLNMNTMEGISTLGTDPLIQISNDVKKFTENFAKLASGHPKLQVDVFTSADRLHERRLIERRRRQRRGQQPDR
ncbi:hypothetical protein ASD99_14885 [Mesorhizobium sp. Root695]|uniref:hypothetical protein n=1 Tax=Mesorhizobium sp. Root695 TaxID=1736589 RepID=UPI00070A6B51|nr:hypothetical protein [Mesorhizobium sp. Root695]KRB13953.1 hypothetical protein ASD99_14885 [Mesorhizobium sp. Root695]